MGVLLISDLHLQEERPDLTRAFLQFLQTRALGSEALYILGDFFEVWIGDDAMTPFQHGIAGALRRLSDAGTRVYLMHGNRDFLIGRAFCREAGCQLLPEPSVVELGGEPVLLMHGDSLCTQDTAYMKLRRWRRNPLSLFLLRRLPLRVRQQLARRLRHASRARTPQKPCAITDVTPAAVPAALEAHGVQTLIHGHTHRPASHSLLARGRPARRIVLGDWDRQGWLLAVDAQGFHLESFPLT